MTYSAANRLTPDDIYAASRRPSHEIAHCGITAVGEFHYIHKAPGGSSYSDPNLLSKSVIAAAESVGIRITLLRVAYVRSGFETEPNPLQEQFIEADPSRFLEHFEELKQFVSG